MLKRVIVLIGAAAMVPGLASAQSTHDEPGVRAVSRVVVAQQARRPEPRVIAQGRERDGRVEQTETFQKTVRIGNSGELEVANIAGNIEIKRGGGNDAVIDVVKVARGRTAEDAREMLGLVNVEISERGNRAEVRTQYPRDQHIMNNRRNVNVAVHYTITAPANTRITARSISGHVRSADIAGELSLMTTSGDVQIVRARRVSSAKSTSGNVELSDIDSDMPLEAGSVSGDILSHRVKAAALEMSTVSGKVHMQDVTCARIEAQSLSGDVTFEGPFAKGGRYELNSHSGNIRLAVAGNTGFQVEANSWSGNVESQLAMTGGTQTTNSGRGPRRKELRGVVGDGSAVVEVTTFSGNVLITKR